MLILREYSNKAVFIGLIISFWYYIEVSIKIFNLQVELILQSLIKYMQMQTIEMYWEIN